MVFVIVDVFFLIEWGLKVIWWIEDVSFFSFILRFNWVYDLEIDFELNDCKGFLVFYLVIYEMNYVWVMG